MPMPAIPPGAPVKPVSSGTAVAGANLTANRLCYIAADGTLALADATTAGKAARMFVKQAYSTGQAATWYGVGHTMIGLSGLTPGADQFLSTTPGALTATAPNATGNVVQKVGTALSATSILFSPSLAITL